MENEEKVTSDSQTSAAEKQPDTAVETLTVMDRDPKTGQRKEKAIQLTKEQKDALAQKGYRFEQEMGLLKNKSREDAEKMAAQMTQAQMQQFIAALQEKQPDMKAPTVEQLQENPGLIVDYVDKVRQKDKEEILATTRKERAEEDRQKKEDDEVLFAYDTEIKAVLVDFPLLSKNVLVDRIAIRKGELDEIRGLAEELQEEILATIDPEKLPDDKKKAYAAALKAEQPPPAGVEGSATETKQPISKTVDGVYEEEAKKHGWKL